MLLLAQLSGNICSSAFRLLATDKIVSGLCFQGLSVPTAIMWMVSPRMDRLHEALRSIADEVLAMRLVEGFHDKVVVVWVAVLD